MCVIPDGIKRFCKSKKCLFKMKILNKKLFLLMLEILQINRFVGWVNRGKIKVLLYHSISSKINLFPNAVAPEAFEWQISYLKNNYNVMDPNNLDELQKYSKDRINIILTFDDGFENNKVAACDVLHRYGIKGIFFIIADCIEIGSVPRFVQQEKNQLEQNADFKTVNVEDALAMQKLGLVIGAHSVYHDNYLNIKCEDGCDDAKKAKEILEKVLNKKVNEFAFPWGRHHPEQPKLLLSEYRRVYLTEHGFNNVGDRVMFRNEVSSSLHFRAAASGSLDFFRVLFRMQL